MDERTREAGRPGRYMFTQAAKAHDEATNPFGEHEVTTATHAEDYLLALWHAADRKKLNPLFEKRSSQSRFLVHCSAVDWAFIQGEARTA